MYYYEIKLKDIPKISFSCRVESRNYKNKFPHTNNLLELSVCEKGDIIHEYENGERDIFREGALVAITKITRCVSYAVHEGIQRHITVGLVGDYDCEKKSIACCPTGEEVRERGLLLIPFNWELGEHYDEVVEILEKITQAYTSISPCGEINAISLWYRLVGLLTELVLKKRDNSGIYSPGAVNYVKKAKEYIKSNYNRNIKVEELASQLDISVGYLQRIFKQVSRMSIVEYINFYKINMAKQYIKSGNISLKETAYRIGIDDPAYMSRLFKKVTGVSWREYCENMRDY